MQQKKEKSQASGPQKQIRSSETTKKQSEIRIKKLLKLRIERILRTRKNMAENKSQSFKES